MYRVLSPVVHTQTEIVGNEVMPAIAATSSSASRTKSRFQSRFLFVVSRSGCLLDGLNLHASSTARVPKGGQIGSGQPSGAGG